MKLQYCIAVLLLMLWTNRPNAQIITFKPLQVNDTVPDVALNMINSYKAAARLNDFKDKLLILDFWSTTCTSCIYHIHELDSLQRLFGKTIYIVPVSSARTGDNAQMIKRFITGYKQRMKGGFILPSVVNDSILDKLFPHIAVPHFVWINKGVYAGATSAEDLTAANIKNVINGAPVHLKQKINEEFYDVTRPLVSYINGSKENLHSTTILADFISDLSTSSGLFHDKTGTKLYAINYSAIGLYKRAYPAASWLPNNRIINELPANNPVIHTEGNDKTGDNANLYCYELVAEGISDPMMFRRMQQDLCNYFKIQGSMEKRKMSCLVFEAADTSLLHTSGGIEGNSLYEAVEGKRVIINERLGELIERLNDLLPIPVIDETRITKKIDLELPNDLTDIAALRKSLRAQGIALTETERELDMFVLRQE